MTWRVCESRYIGLRGGYRVEEKIFRRILWMIALHVCGLDWILEYYENFGGPGSRGGLRFFTLPDYSHLKIGIKKVK